MTVSASILVPYRPDGGNRDISWNWVKRRWESLFPDYPIYVGDSVSPDGFQCTAASNQAASQSNSEIYIFADCDTTTDPEWVNEAIDEILSGKVPWGLYTTCDKLDKQSTEKILKNSPKSEIRGRGYSVEETTTGVSWGGVFVCKREDFWAVGGYDERFTVWGAYDACFGLSMYSLIGPPKRYNSHIYHLWHPQNLGALFGHEDQRAQQELTRRYQDAVERGPDAMREVRFGN